jgi:hypothetical protein
MILAWPAWPSPHLPAWAAWLFDAAPFSPRSTCGPGWTDDLVRLSLVANGVIWLSYWSIAWQFARFWGRVRGRVGESWIILAIAGFVAACGATHLDDVLVFSWPAYRYFVANEALTAAVSAFTAASLPNVLKYLVGLPAPEDLRAALAAQDVALRDADAARRGQDLAYRALEHQRIEDANLAVFYKTKLTILEGNLSRSMDHVDRTRSIEDVRAMLALLQDPGDPGPRDRAPGGDGRPGDAGDPGEPGEPSPDPRDAADESDAAGEGVDHVRPE